MTELGDKDVVTPPEVYFNRRSFMRAGAIAAGMAGTGLLYRRLNGVDLVMTETAEVAGLTRPADPGFRVTGEAMTPRESILNYNNYYEFSPDKDGVAKAADGFKTAGWEDAGGGASHH